MIRNYLQFAWRKLLADKKASLINLGGLTIGLAAFLLIVEYVIYERSYDSFHDKKDRIVRVGVEVLRSNKSNIRSAINYAAVAPILKSEYSEVEKYVRLFGGESTVTIGDQRFREDKMYFADPDFFQVFSVDLVQGDKGSVLREPNSIVISSSMAEKYFNTVNCVGNRLRIQNYFPQTDYVVTGVFKDIPQNSHLEGEMFLSFTTFSNQPGYIPDWNWRDFYTYVLLKEGTDQEAFTEKITSSDFINKHNPAFTQRNTRHQLIVQPLTSIYLFSDLVHEIGATGNGKMTSYLLLIGVFVLGMAWINYINFSTATAMRRLKEIGIRKTIGALKKNLLVQFLVEAFLLNAIALLLAIAVMLIAKPFFHALIGKSLTMPITVWLGLVLLLAAGVLISVWYPATVLSSFSPLKALKNEKLSATKGNIVRKSLIVFQFSISLVLIIGTAVVLMQLRHMQKAKLGINLEQNIVVRAPVPNDSTAYSKYLVFKEQLLSHSIVKAVAASHVVPGDESEWTPAIRRLSEPGVAMGQGLTASANAIEPGFLEEYGVAVKYGRDLSKERGMDSRSILLTETACSKLNYDDPQQALNQRLLIVGDTFTVVGVTADFRHYSMKYAPQPYVFFQRPDEYRKYSVKVSGNDIAGSIDLIRQTYQKVFPQNSFEYVFADDLFGRQYTAEKRLGVITSLFTAIAIIIACLGLLGLTIFITQQRMKEISIRKVLGATVFSITTMLSGNFLKLVLLSALIAIPASWWMMSKWLDNFAYRIHLQWWIFGAACLLVLLIALITISFQAIKAAIANPVKSLRTE